MEMKELDIVFGSTLCVCCRHFDWERNTEFQWLCTAFPNGIPWEIVNARFDHRKPHPADNGVRFEIKDGLEKLPDWVDEEFAWFNDSEDEDSKSDSEIT